MPGAGVLPSQALSRAIDAEWVSSGDYRIRPEAIQPASIDLRLGDFAWALRCSFLPDVDSTVEEKIEGLAFQKIDLRDGAVLERDRPYLVPLIEELALPEDVRAKANPKSSTGRLDVFTRVLTDRHHRFDEIRAGYRGKLYLEVVPRSFAIQVQTGLSLNQLRLVRGDVRLGDEDIRDLQARVPAALPRLPRPGRVGAGACRWTLPQRRPLRARRPHRRLPGEEEQPADRPLPDPRLPLDRLLGPGLPGGRRADRPGAGDLLPAALGRGGLHPAADRRRDDGLRPDRRRAAHPLRRASSTPGSATTRPASATAAAPRWRCGPATSPSWSSTASRSASWRWSG